MPLRVGRVAGRDEVRRGAPPPNCDAPPGAAAEVRRGAAVRGDAAPRLGGETSRWKDWKAQEGK